MNKCTCDSKEYCEPHNEKWDGSTSKDNNCTCDTMRTEEIGSCKPHKINWDRRIQKPMFISQT